MSVVVSVADTRKRLSEFISNLSDVINRETIQTEADLEKFVQVKSKAQLDLREALGYVKTETNATLLEILGYRPEDVDDHLPKRVIVGQIRYSPDYVLKFKQKPFAIVDLKSPDTNIDHERWVGQIRCYCRDESAPIGILFNGRSLRVFINTELKGLTKYDNDFKGQPVAAADQHEVKQMVEMLLKFASMPPEANPIALARGFANKRLKESSNRKWQDTVVERVRHLLTDPSDDVLAAIAGVESAWNEIEPKPSSAELEKIWRERPTLMAKAIRPRKKLI